VGDERSRPLVVRSSLHEQYIKSNLADLDDEISRHHPWNRYCLAWLAYIPSSHGGRPEDEDISHGRALFLLNESPADVVLDDICLMVRKTDFHRFRGAWS
jgi:hypothetical protein